MAQRFSCERSAKHLLSYSAAAGLGAFAFGIEAQATVRVNMSEFGETHVYGELGPNVDILNFLDINGDGINDALHVTGLNGAQALVAAAGTTILSNTPATVFIPGTNPGDPPIATGQSYYVLGFGSGGAIDFTSDDVGGGANLTYITLNLYGYYTYYNHVANGDWIGLAFDIGGNTHFGAVEIILQSGRRASPNGTVSTVEQILNNPNPISTTLGRMIWEDQPNTPCCALTPSPLTGDLDLDSFVGITDLNIVLGSWNLNVTPGDLLLGDPSGDGFVGIEDLNLVLGNWNAGTPPPGDANVIPEPATLLMLAFGLGAVGLRRKQL